MQESSSNFLRGMGVILMLYCFIRIILLINDLSQGKIGEFFRAIPLVFPKTFSENTLWAIMIFFPVAYAGYFILKYSPELTIMLIGIMISLLTGFFENIWLIPILSFVVLIPFLAEKFCRKMFDSENK